MGNNATPGLKQSTSPFSQEREPEFILSMIFLFLQAQARRTGFLGAAMALCALVCNRQSSKAEDLHPKEATQVRIREGHRVLLPQCKLYGALHPTGPFPGILGPFLAALHGG